MYVMNYETWMELTRVRGKLRSRELKAVDSALKKYHLMKQKQDLEVIKRALILWKMAKGFDRWRSSPRNLRKGIETLDLQLFGFRDANAQSVLNDLAELPYFGIESWAGEEAAKNAMKNAREEALVELFCGKELIVDKCKIATIGYFIKRRINKIRGQAAKAGGAAVGDATEPAVNAAKEAIKETKVYALAREGVQQVIDEVLSEFPVEIVQEAMKTLAELVPDFIGEVAASVTPYIGVGISGSKSIRHVVQGAKTQYKLSMAREHTQKGFGQGNPLAAAQALERIIQRERNRHSELAALFGSDTVVKGAGLACDALSFGAPTVSLIVTPTSGVIAGLAALSLAIFQIAQNIKEMREGNKILAHQGTVKLSHELFNACPILGCYFIACSNTSDIINFLVDDIGVPGWNLDVEVMARNHIHPMVGYARDTIQASPFAIEGLELSKGVVMDASQGLSNTGNRVKKKMIGKLKGALKPLPNLPDSMNDMQDYRVFARNKQGVKAVSRDILKARIGGISPKH